MKIESEIGKKQSYSALQGKFMLMYLLFFKFVTWQRCTLYTVSHKKGANLLSVTSSNVNRFRLDLEKNGTCDVMNFTDLT